MQRTSDTGWLSILKGALTPMSFFGESMMMTMFLSFMEMPDQGPSKAMWGVGIAVFTVSVATLAVVCTFGPGVSSKMWYPFYEIVRFISVFEFIENHKALYTELFRNGP